MSYRNGQRTADRAGASVVIPFGRFKGKSLSAIGDSQLEDLTRIWGARDGINESEIYHAAVDELARRKLRNERAVSASEGETRRRVPNGKHRGKALSQLDDKELQGLQGAWAGNEELRKDSFFALIQAEVKRRGLKVVDPDQRRNTLSGTRSLARHHVLNYLRKAWGNEIPDEVLQMVETVLNSKGE